MSWPGFEPRISWLVVQDVPEIFHSPLLFQISPPDFVKLTCFLHTLYVFRCPPILTMMQLCITQGTYWTPLFMTMTNLPDTNVRYVTCTQTTYKKSMIMKSVKPEA